jgi:ubiquinol-cytochrome c reductase cytochrome b subunit
MIAQVATIYYFAHFLIILPLVSKFEKTLPLPNSIAEACSMASRRNRHPSVSGQAGRPAPLRSPRLNKV